MTTVSTGSPGPSVLGANDQDLAPGSEVGEYRIEGELGKGGFGTVYQAVQPLIGKRVAIKVLARRYSADPAIVSRFVAEARAVNQIRHRNIIDIFSFGQLSDGRHYYVMEYLDGEPLDVHIRTHGPMSLEHALPVLRSIARALDAAHAKGIAHRDLKPENIFLAEDADGGRYPKLLDFGIAKLLAPEDDVRHKTGTGVPIGTPYYMSPEQCRGREVDHRTDIYSFGIVAYRLLTGTFPFEGDDYMELLFKQINEEAPPPSSRNPRLSRRVDDAIAWMMRKDREQRPPNVVEGVNALDPSQAMTPSTPLPPSSKASVAPPRTASANSSNPDALAATFTPEFQRVSSPTLAPAPAPRRSRWPLALALLLVFAGGGVAAFVLAGGARSPAASAPTAAPATPVVQPEAAQQPAQAPTAPAVPPVEPAVASPAPGAEAPAAPPTPATAETTTPAKATTSSTKTSSTTSTKKSSGASKATTKTTAKQSATPASSGDDAPPAKGDIIHLGSDTFKDK